MIEISSLMEALECLEDPRQEWKVKHKLAGILLISLLAIIANAETVSQIHDFAVTRQAWLKRFMPLENGIPCRLTISRVLQMLSPKVFSEFFAQLMAGVAKKTEGRVVAIDGKALLGTQHNDGKKGLLYMVSAWCSENKLTLGQVRTQEKSNEITAVPELLDMLDLRGAVVTLDAMGCQKSIAAKIYLEKKADYLIGLKGNQGTMRDEFLEYALCEAGKPKVAGNYEKTATVEKGHGRIETREYWLFRDILWFENSKEWAGLSGLLMVRSSRKDVKSGKESEPETRLYITSMAGGVTEVARAARSHWGIENKLHWVLDIGFSEDQWLTRLEAEAANLAQLRRLAANVVKLDTERQMSVKRKRFRAAMDVSYLEHLVNISGLFS